MDLRELAIVVGMAPVMVLIRLLIQRLSKGSAFNIYTLSDSKGNKVDVVLPRHASAEEQVRIINEKVRELTERQSA